MGANAAAAAVIYKSASDFERVKASKLRRKTTLTKLQRQWLTAYEARVEAARASRKSERVANTNVSFAQSTSPPSQFSGDSMLWAPAVPEPSPDEAPPPPGVEPPKPGDPIVDTAAPAADPAAAQQAAMLMAMIVRAGILAAMELLADVPLPDQYRAVLSAPSSHNEVIVACSSAAYRLAIKYNMAAVPLSDEITCGVAVAASAGAWFAVHKKKKKAAEDHTRVERAKDANADSDPRVDPAKIDDDGRPLAKAPVAGIW